MRERETENDRGEEKKRRQQDTKTSVQLENRTEALCSVGKVVYCPAALQCINYRMRNDKLCCRAMNRQTDRQLTVQPDADCLWVRNKKAS